MRYVGILLFAAFLLTACDAMPSTTTVDAMQAEPEATPSATPPFLPGALFERTWANNHQWELVKPRPPGIGANEGVVIDIYQIAPVVEADPLSPPIDVPGVITLGGRDHVMNPPRGNGGTFRAVGRTVPILLPGWNPPMPFPTPAECADLGPGPLDRIAWRWLEVSVHPCEQLPQVYAVDFVGDGECFVPLTTVDLVEQAVAEGFGRFEFPPEEPWPFAIRPLTEPGEGTVTVEAPDCV